MPLAVWNVLGLTWRTHSCVQRSHSCERIGSTGHECSHECEHGTQECVRHGGIQ
jgi:hypothetical protein